MGQLISLGVKHDGERLVVSSRIVADNFEKRHDNVVRDIDEIVVGLLRIEDTRTDRYFIPSTYTHEQNSRRYPEYLLTRDGFTLLTMGWTGEKAMRFKVAYINEFNRMEQALRSQTPFRIPQTLAEALRLAADQADRLEEQQRQIQLLTPAAEFGKAVGSSDGAILIRDFVKVLAGAGIQIGQDKFFSWLHVNGYIFRQAGQWAPYRQYVNQGLFRVTEKAISTHDHGDFIRLTIRITGKGQKYFHDKLKSVPA